LTYGLIWIGKTFGGARLEDAPLTPP